MASRKQQKEEARARRLAEEQARAERERRLKRMQMLTGGAQSRREIHAPLADGQEGHVPAQLADLVSDVTAGLPLGPIAFLMTRRTVRNLLGGASDILAEVADAEPPPLNAVTAETSVSPASAVPTA